MVVAALFIYFWGKNIRTSLRLIIPTVTPIPSVMVSPLLSPTPQSSSAVFNNGVLPATGL